MERQISKPLTIEEARILKALVFDLSERAAKQSLYAIVQYLASYPRITKHPFAEILDDARKLTGVTKQNTAQKD